MPYAIVREKLGAHKRFWGVVTPEEFLESVERFHSDPFFENIRYTINDFTATESFVLSESHIEDAAAINIGSAATNARITVLAVTTNPLIIGMAKKYDQLHLSTPILIFATLEEARAWIKAEVGA